MRGVIIVIFFSCCFTISATADERVGLPNYDPEHVCAMYFSSFGTQVEKRLKIHYINQCIREEQSGYDHLKSIWFSASNAAELTCIGNNLDNPPIYVRYNLLDRCIDFKYRQEQKHETTLIHFKR